MRCVGLGQEGVEEGIPGQEDSISKVGLSWGGGAGGDGDSDMTA